jgi:hypothetical protein
MNLCLFWDDPLLPIRRHSIDAVTAAETSKLLTIVED